jgi:CRISPR-associated protein Cas2
MMTESQMSKVQIKIDQYIDTSTDKVVYYNICVNCFTKIIKQPQQEIENPTIKVI